MNEQMSTLWSEHCILLHSVEEATVPLRGEESSPRALTEGWGSGTPHVKITGEKTLHPFSYAARGHTENALKKKKKRHLAPVS